ncbi:MAG: FtsH protease activity modulator HflK [Alphaproteobacteria bacterium]|nr:FtsH protease activity modulator HflK [Alphaproteobacteria bacterium]MDD9919094.1 FtsH protease activity modulator HflK [Alphaproteobacteria bacterium]
MKIFEWDNGEGPWGAPKKPRKTGSQGQRRGSGQDQPDIEEVVRFAQERFKNSFGGGDGGGLPSGRVAGLIAIGLFVLWLFSGFYIVAPDQQGVVLRFGKYVQTTDSGLHWHLPVPIETVLKPQVTRENVMQVGGGNIVSNDGGGFSFGRSVSRASVSSPLMLTGDENIVDLSFTVRWKISDARDYLFNITDVADTVQNVAESVMREVIGRRPIDDALTGNKTEIQQEAQERMQEVLDSYRAGVAINGVELQEVNPPREVIDAFRDVQAARADAEKAVNEAMGYANDILPRARGQVAQVMQEAEAYKASRIAQAEGDASRFTSQLVEYRKAPSVTRKRLYLEAMQSVVESSDKIILPKGSGGNILPYLPLKKEGK